LGDEGKVGKNGEANILLSCKAGPSIWIDMSKRSTFLIAIVYPHFILRKEHPERKSGWSSGLHAVIPSQ